jgi:3-oxoacyl-[acyl-carrier-protein] synthase III
MQSAPVVNTPVVTALAAYVPPAVPFQQWRQIEEKLHATALTGWPRLVYPPWFAAYGLDLQRLTAPPEDGLSASAKVIAPIADFVPIEPCHDLSGLAAHVAQVICPNSGGGAPPVGAVIFCHSGLNEQVSTTTAGRLCAVLGEHPFSFSIAQQQGASVFSALRLASDLLVAEAELRAILIVAAEKWCHPFARRIGHWTLQGDAAGAMLLERSPSSMPGLRLLATVVQPLCRADAPFGLPMSLTDTNDIFASPLIALIDTLLRQRGLRPGDIAAVIAHRVNQPLIDVVTQRLGLPHDDGVAHRRAYLGSAECIVRLAETLDTAQWAHGAPLLAWGVGLGGYVSCALLEAHGTPVLRFTGTSPKGPP